MKFLSGAIHSRSILVQPPVVNHDNDTTLQLQVVNSGNLQVVNIIKRLLMASDYHDLRFCINPTGTTAQKKYLPYYIRPSSITGSGCEIIVGFQTAISPGDIFYCIWGNAAVSNVSNIYDPFALTGWYGNDFSRGIWWDTGKYYGSDKKPFSDAITSKVKQEIKNHEAKKANPDKKTNENLTTPSETSGSLLCVHLKKVS